MAKIFYLVTIYLIIGLSAADSKNSHSFFSSFFRLFLTPTSICTNSTNSATQTAYLTKILPLINAFQLNATYNAVLQIQSPNFIAYVKNPTYQGLLYSNCTAFVSGIKTAKSADRAAAQTRRRISQDIYQRFRQVPRDVTGSNGPNDMDINESDEYHF